MGIKRDHFYIMITLLILLAVGIWSIQKGNIAFGASLIGASVGVGIMRYIKEKRIAKLKAAGLNPHDERTMHIVGLASTFTINFIIFLIAIVILVGAVLGSEIMVNPYDLLGFCLAGIVLIYIMAFYYYSRLN
ncbi:MAG: DUF2178 domain-containing protein [Syntrophomonadaceae bacterium]|nr:DUF2178 domain-containing protein [Syntrophomonadaceae bacterium]